MVNKAKEETAQSNKLLDEARGRIAILEAELNALKMLIVNFNSNESKHPAAGLHSFSKQHKRAASHSNSFLTSPVQHSPSVTDSLAHREQADTSGLEVSQCPGRAKQSLECHSLSLFADRPDLFQRNRLVARKPSV
jgi:hypothetical protein